MVVIAGSPRKGRCSDRIAAHFAELTGSSLIHARDLDVVPCRACGYCKGKGDGECIQKDDMGKVIDSIMNENGIVLVSPVYWWQTTAQIKIVIDRLYALKTEDLKGKKLAVIMNGEAEESDAEYRILSEQFSQMADYLGMKFFFLGVGTPEGNEELFGNALRKAEEFADTVRQGIY